MEPKDLKNSEELKSTQKADLENSEKKDDSKKEVKKEKTDNKETTATGNVSEESEVQPDKISEIEKAEKSVAEKPVNKPAEEAPEDKTETSKQVEATETNESATSPQSKTEEVPVEDEPEKTAVNKTSSEEITANKGTEDPEVSEEIKPEPVTKSIKEKKAEVINETAAKTPKEEVPVENKQDETVEDKTSSEEKTANEVTEDTEVSEEIKPEPVTKSIKEKEAEIINETAAKTPKEEVPVENKQEETVEDKTSSEEKTVNEATEDPEVSEEIKPEPVAKSADKTKDEEPVEPAAKPEKEQKIVIHKKEKTDYSKLSEVELVNALKEVLDKNEEEDIKDEVDNIKAAFYKLINENEEEQKKEFIKEGGNEEEFEPMENPYERDIKDLLKRYRQIRIDYNKKFEHEKEKNLELKYQIIEEIKGLINKEESINKTFNDFRDLQQQWREIGLVPQSKMKDLWENYHFHVENFYDYIKINKELRDLDLKKNLEMKIKLCEQAEELLLEPNTIKAFNSLQKLHERWREIGPVPRENKDDLWERFKASTAKINKKHQEYFEDRKTEQKKNLEAKKALCEQVEEINDLDLENHKDWDDKSREVVNLQKMWRTIGFAPRKDNNKIYDRFRKACDTFFDTKRDFYSKNKELQQNNLQMKIDLCVQAESLKDSTEWRKATQDFINIQKQWKEIGPVPRKQSDLIWKRFRAACDYFFDKKADHFSNIDSEQVDNLKKKEQLINDVENFKSTGDVNKNLNLLKDYQRRWTEIGHVPIKKKDEVQKQFREAINKLYDDLNLDETKRNLLKFRTKMTSFSESSRGQNKMRLERDKYMNKLKQLENDLVLLDNNIGFFAKSKNAESLIEDVNKKIEQTREKIEFMKNKIRVIDEMDPSDE